MQSHDFIEGNLRFRIIVESQYVKFNTCFYLPRFTPLEDLDTASKKSYYDELLHKSRVIDRFHETIAPVTPGGSPKSNAQLFVVHTYIRLATIRLGIFNSWGGKRFESALAIANMLDDVDVSNIGYVCPVMGVSRPPTKNTLLC